MRTGDLQNLFAGEQRAETLARWFLLQIGADEKWHGILQVQAA
jgi:hypothetical protein